MDRVLIIVVLLTLAGCNGNNKMHFAGDRRLQLYNDVLDELVRCHFYGLYLDEEVLEDLNKKYLYNPGLFDSIGYFMEIKNLQKSIEADTAKQKSISLRNDLRFDLLEEYRKHMCSIRL